MYYQIRVYTLRIHIAVVKNANTQLIWSSVPYSKNILQDMQSQDITRHASHTILQDMQYYQIRVYTLRIHIAV
jgi:hypothetical protein